MTPREHFKTLVRCTTPHGYEEHVYGLLMREIGAKKLDGMNYYLTVGGNSQVVFTSHLDTAKFQGSLKIPQSIVSLEYADLMYTDGKTNLGADDRAGMAIMLHMIEQQIPGTYVFFIGEECGCVGSSHAARQGMLTDASAIISFDRGGYNDVITHQMSTRTCSDAFGKALASELSRHGLAYQVSDRGSYTDSYEFSGIIPECTNISVGYEFAHTVHEQQCLAHLDALGLALCSLNFASIPVERDPTIDDWDYGYDWKKWRWEKPFLPAQEKLDFSRFVSWLAGEIEDEILDEIAMHLEDSNLLEDGEGLIDFYDEFVLWYQDAL